MLLKLILNEFLKGMKMITMKIRSILLLETRITTIIKSINSKVLIV